MFSISFQFSHSANGPLRLFISANQNHQLTRSPPPPPVPGGGGGGGIYLAAAQGRHEQLAEVPCGAEAPKTARINECMFTSSTCLSCWSGCYRCWKCVCLLLFLLHVRLRSLYCSGRSLCWYYRGPRLQLDKPLTLQPFYILLVLDSAASSRTQTHRPLCRRPVLTHNPATAECVRPPLHLFVFIRFFPSTSR